MPCQVANHFGLPSIQYLRWHLVRLQMVLAYAECLGNEAKPLTAVPYALLWNIIQHACFAPALYSHCRSGWLKQHKQPLLKVWADTDGTRLIIFNQILCMEFGFEQGTPIYCTQR